MNMAADIPATLRAKLSKAGKARWANVTPEQRSAYARKAWKTKLAKAQALEKLREQPKPKPAIPTVTKIWPPQ